MQIIRWSGTHFERRKHNGADNGFIQILHNAMRENCYYKDGSYIYYWVSYYKAMYNKTPVRTNIKHDIVNKM